MKWVFAVALLVLVGSGLWYWYDRDSGPIWLVINVEVPSGEQTRLAFERTSEPKLSLDECRDSIDKQSRNLFEFVQTQAQYKDAKLIGADCVRSKDHPLKD